MKSWRYLVVVYDIAEDSLRGEVATMLLFFGLHRIQNSVFSGLIDRRDAARLLVLIKGLAFGPRDRLDVLDLCASCVQGIVSFGQREINQKGYVVL